MYKVFDCDGLYVVVLILGIILFCYDYCINGCWEMLVIGQYGCDGIMLVEVRDELIVVKKLLNVGQLLVVVKCDGIKWICGVEIFMVYIDVYMKYVVLVDSMWVMK